MRPEYARVTSQTSSTWPRSASRHIQKPFTRGCSVYCSLGMPFFSAKSSERLMLSGDKSVPSGNSSIMYGSLRDAYRFIIAFRCASSASSLR